MATSTLILDMQITQGINRLFITNLSRKLLMKWRLFLVLHQSWVELFTIQFNYLNVVHYNKLKIDIETKVREIDI